MLEYLLWGISFVTLWLTLVWLNFLYAEPASKKRIGTPKITFGIPAHNEAETVLKTVKSILAADYPASKKEIIVVDDGSTDGTASVVRTFIKQNPGVPVQILSKKNGGKASALNAAFERATGEYFSVMDADSRISPESIKASISNFTSKDIGAVISRVRVDEPKNFIERVQRFEYIMSSMIRKIMCNFGTLSITPGVLSIYRMDVLREVGGFTKDEANLTEDLEIAMRLKYHGYLIKMEPKSVTYTHVPSTFDALWRQRVRWARGYIYNHIKYAKMFFSKKHGVFGVFQLPVNVMAVILLIANIGIIAYDLLNRAFDFVFRSLTISDYFWTQITNWPTIQQLILARNVQVYLPIVIALVLGFYLVVFAHRFFQEQFRKQVAPMVAYMIVMPYFSTVNWVSSIVQEIARTKRKW
jgi:cellulose synthase/poly-beta-1,6-N-acetylglucosamine synthase-like glycosyltransferase